MGAGAEEMGRLPVLERRERVVDTREAWHRYPAGTPTSSADEDQRLADPAGVAAAVAAQSAALLERIDRQIEATYLDPPDPGDDALRTRLLQVYVALQRYDTAIEAGTTHLSDRRGDKAATHNHLGIAYYLKGDMTQAAYHFQQASDLRPDDPGIGANLDRVLRALGREDSSTPVVAAEYSTADSTKAARQDVAAAFYWIE